MSLHTSFTEKKRQRRRTSLFSAYAPTGCRIEKPHVFGSTFYVLTGTHGTHVAIGVFWLIGWFVYSFTGKMSTAHAIDIECCGLYWHFVDIVWIIIFPWCILWNMLFEL